MYRCSSWGRSCQPWRQLLESRKKQVRVEERSRDTVCGCLFGWWSPPGSTERSEPAGNRLLHECPQEPSCPTFKIFAAPVVPTPAFWVRWKKEKGEKGEHWWKSKCFPLPLPERVLQWARKPVSIRRHSHPSAGNSHISSTMKFMQFFFHLLQVASSMLLAGGSTCGVWNGGVLCEGVQLPGSWAQWLSLLMTLLGNGPCRESISAMAREGFSSLLGSSSLVSIFLFCCSSLTTLGHTPPPCSAPPHKCFIWESTQGCWGLN